MKKKYKFIDQKNGKVVYLRDFSFVLENQDCLGFLTWRGRLLKRDLSDEFVSEIRQACTRNVNVGPLNRVSEAGAVHPSQVEDARSHYRGVHPGISFDDSGLVRFSSRGARKSFLKAARMVDNDGGYGD